MNQTTKQTIKEEDEGSSDKGERFDSEPGTPLQVEIEGIAFRFKTTLVGMETDRYLIIKVPAVPREVPLEDIRSKLSPGVQIVVRCLQEGRVIGFRSRLTKAIFTPQSLMFIEYPKTIEHHDIRSNKRISCTLPAKMIINNNEFKGTMQDISRKGCRYMTKVTRDIKLLSLKKEDQISIQCQFPGIQNEQDVLGNIKNMEMDKQELAIGIRFQEMEADVKGIIDRYISTIEEFS